MRQCIGRAHAIRIAAVLLCAVAGPQSIALGGSIKSTGQAPGVQSAGDPAMASANAATTATSAAATSAAAATAAVAAASQSQDTAAHRDITPTLTPRHPAVEATPTSVIDVTAGAAPAAELDSSMIQHAASLSAVHKGASTASADCEATHAAIMQQSFISAGSFAGSMSGMTFKYGTQGLGYYTDDALLAEAGSGSDTFSAPDGTCLALHGTSSALTGTLACKGAASVQHTTCVSNTVTHDSTSIKHTQTAAAVPTAVSNLHNTTKLVASKQGVQMGESQITESATNKKADTDEGARSTRHSGVAEDSQSGHYWGQALQYLDRAIQVRSHSLHMHA